LFGLTSVDDSKRNVHSAVDGEPTGGGVSVPKFERKAS